jgi:WD40 repeat protein
MTRETSSELEGSRVQLPHGQGVQIGDNNRQLNQFLKVGKLHSNAPHISKPSYRETLRVIRGRTRALLEREYELAQLSRFATGGREFGASNYLWITGDAWAGKTALLAEAVQDIPRKLPKKYKVDIVAYFLVGRESQASREQFLIVITSQLCYLLKVSSPPVVDIHVYRDLWARAAVRAVQKERYLLLVVDGLDEDLRPGGRSVAALLPAEHLSSRARVLVSSRPHPTLPYDVDASHPLRATSPATLSASPHAAELKLLAQQEINALLSSEAASAQHSSDLPFDVLGLLTAASGGLTAQDIAAMTAINPRHIRAFINDRAARSLQPVRLGKVAGEPRFQFAHQTLLDYCRTNPDVGEEIRYREMIFNWADEWCRRGWPTSAVANTQTPLYLLDSYPAMLAADQEGLDHRSPELDRLANLVSDVGWIDAALTEVGAEPVVAALRIANQMVPDRNSVAAMLRVVELPENQWSGPQESYPSDAVAKLARGAITNKLNELAEAAGDRLRRYPPPYMVPIWVDGRTAARQAPTRVRHDGAIRAVAFGPDGTVFSGGSVDGAVRLWDAAVPGDPGRQAGRHDGVVLAVVVTTGGMVASGGLDGVVRLWDPAMPDKGSRELGHHGGAVRALVVSSDGRLASGGEDGTVRLWDPAVPSHAGRIVGRHDGSVRGVGATSDGHIVSAGLDGAVRLWNPADPGHSGLELGRHLAVMAVAVTPEGQVISVGLGGEVRLWDRSSPGVIRNEMPARNATRTVAATANGQVVCGCANGIIRLWDYRATNDRATAVAGYRGAVSALAIGPDGWIAAANDNVLTIFELAC